MIRPVSKEEAFKKYHYGGRLVRCHEKGFGFVGDYFVHVRACAHHLESMLPLEGTHIVYALGGNPGDYKRNRPGWRHAVVEWIPLENVSGFSVSDKPSEYLKELKPHLTGLRGKSLRKLLETNWYKRRWNRVARCDPPVGLTAIPDLTKALKQAVHDQGSLEELDRLLRLISQSYWFRNDDKPADPFAVLDLNAKDLEDLELWIRPSSHTLSGFNAPHWDPYREMFLRKSILRNAVAFDIEANARDIFQIACCWEKASSEDREAGGLSTERIQAVIDTANESLPGVCWTGHNILNWDVPRLKEAGICLPDETPVWDTLLMGWLLEPWKQSHALVVRNGAHQASADAADTLALFKSQAVRFAPFIQGIVCNMQWVLETLMSSLDKDGQGLPAMTYPDAPASPDDQTLLISHGERLEYLWCTGISLVDPDGRLDSRDPVLIPSLCGSLAKETNDVSLLITAIAVQQARLHAVEVRLSMIPAFILDAPTRSALHELHISSPRTEEFGTARPVFLVDDMEWGALTEKLADPGCHSPAPLELLCHMLGKHCQSLTVQQIEQQEQKPPAMPSTTALYVKRGQVGLQGLRFDPPGLGDAGTLWALLPVLPPGLTANLLNRPQNRPVPAELWMPRWREGSLMQLDTDWFFISPETTNRRLYLQDLLLRMLNLIHGQEAAGVWILAMRHRGEADWMLQKLTLLGYSVDHADTPLRQLENLQKRGRSVLVTTNAGIPSLLRDAATLELHCHVLFDEVPVLEWVYLTQAMQQVSGDSGAPEENEWMRVHLTEAMLRRAIRQFLTPWLTSLCKAWPESLISIGVLDPRIPTRAAALASPDVTVRDVAYHGEAVLRDERQEALYREWCVAPASSEEPACQYDDLKAVLKNNWHFPDFLPVQQPAIEAIASSRKDILLRLPTGAGKSVVFQVPAFWYGEKTKKLTVVISPLRALMKDQVANLNKAGFVETVDYLSGGRDPLENRAVYQGMLDGRIRLVYTAPERFRLPRFTEILERRRALDGGLQFIVMDEAHCVSEWGFEFRPDYLFAANYIRKWFKLDEIVGNPHRILALSATVTEKNREDMGRELALGGTDGEGYHDLPEKMPHPIQDFIILNSVEAHSSEDPVHDQKLMWLIGRIQKFDIRQSGLVVFARRRKDCYDVSAYVNQEAGKPDSPIQGCSAAPFHAGMDEANKAEVLEGFRSGDIHVLVCTKAFGMGMDIGHIHHCIHLTPPTFIEDYLQEVGRVGRDKKRREDAGHIQVTADLLYSDEEISRQKELLEKNSIKPGFVRGLHDWILSNMIRPVEDQPALCLVPVNLKEAFPEAENEVKLSQGLFWLERMETLRIEGRFPPCLTLVVKPPALERWLEDTSSNAKAMPLARFLKTELEPASKEPGPIEKLTLPPSSYLFAGILKGLKAGILSFFGVKSTSSPNQQERPLPVRALQEVRLAVPIQKLLSDCDFASPDEIYLAVMDLNNDAVLSLEREIFAKRYTLPSGLLFTALLDHVIDGFASETDEGVVAVPVEDLIKDHAVYHLEQIAASMPEKDFQQEGAKIEKQAKRESARAVWSAVYLLHHAGYNIEERINRNGINVIVRSVPTGGLSRAARQVVEWRDQTQRLLRTMGFAEGVEESSIQLVDALQNMRSQSPHTDLMHSIKFLSKAGFLEWTGIQQEWNVLVRVLREEVLPAFDETWSPEKAEEQEPRMRLPQQQYRDMEERHALRKIRALCMHLLCILPEESKRRFIDGYFEAKSKEDLQKILAEFAGELDTEASGDINALLVEARQERFAEEYEKLNDTQQRICAMDVRRKIMVNAGPGSGKTKVLTMRCAHLIHRQGVPPAEILVLAFNRAVVSEIKERVQSLFRELGYGGYARALKVYTFHSFAIQQLQDVETFDEEAISAAVRNFAGRMENETYASGVASKYQAVLVDEFQDMTSDFYTVVSKLIQHCRGGGMVIGDDDQDILGWNRTAAPYEAYEYFSRFREDFQPSEESLLINYRSAISIVDAANRNIQLSQNNIDFLRIKNECMIAAREEVGRAGHQSVNTPEEANAVLLESIRDSIPNANQGSNTLAILCRTNKECFAIQNLLNQHQEFAGIPVRVLGQTDYSLFQLRETATLLDVCQTYDSFQFVEEHVWREIMDKVQGQNLPDFEEQRPWFQLIYDTSRREQGRLRCHNLIDFLMETKTSDLSRLEQRHRTAGESARSEIIISTIHKVKGLEFDKVIIPASFFDFGRKKDDYGRIQDLVGVEMSRARAEEARLLFVAMTRAQNELSLIIGPRFQKWFNNGLPYHHDGELGCAGYQGDPKEIFVSWPGRTEQVNIGLQEYIRHQVKAGDTVRFSRNEIWHNDREIGVLSRLGNRMRQEIRNPRLKVGAVMRYSCGIFFKIHHPDLYDALHPSIKQQGWFYTCTVQSC